MAQASVLKLVSQKPQELMVGLGIVTILGVMVMPIPTMLLDLLLSFSITFSLIVLMVAVFMLSPLEFSVFPSLLLIITLLRLSLNIASTRIILLNGDQGSAAAGQVIESFGSFVVGGNYLVGTVIFIILVMINFIVITKGSVRTSGVAAGFTLDAIPGKQMSIDADLNAGLITEQEARTRRRNLEREADFYGSMDGAIRFVRGDAIAGILITLVNIIGGFAIGVFQQDMAAGEAAQVYTLLTIGDGLVSQLPALVVFTAAGLVVTRSVSDKNLPGELIKQLLDQPYAFIIASGILFFFGLIPGLPHLPFLLLSFGAGAIGFYKIQDDEKVVQLQLRKKEDEAKIPIPEKVESILPLDIMELEVGYELIPLVDADRNGELLERIKSIRRQFALEMGFIVPPLHIRDNLQLKSNEYAVLIKGVDVARGSIMMGRILAMNPGTTDREIEGIKTTEPTFGLPAVWIPSNKKQEAQVAGYTVVDPATVIATHIKETIKRHAHELMGRQEVQALLDKFKETNPKVVEELIPTALSLGKVQRVLQNLLSEQISIRDLRTILEKLSDYASLTQDPDVLTEYVRQGLARPITKLYQSNDGTLSVMTLDRGIEDVELKSLIFNLLSQTDQARSLGLEPHQFDTYSRLVENGLDEKLASKILQRALEQNSQQTADCGKEPVMNLMKKVLPCKGEIDLKGFGPKMVAFVGPTGVGKTTTVAKIAAEYALRRGQKVALVSLDTYRLGAIDQLKIYGEIMEVPVEVAGGKEDLLRIVASHSDKDIILVDTTGRSHQDKDYSWQLKEIFDAVGGVEIHLVLSVTSQEKLFTATYRQFSPIGVDRVLFTKLDEGLSFGSLFNFSVRNRLPISYFTSGQRVPEDLEVARPERVISLIFN